MANDKEFREFFVRNTQVNTGAKPDQEVGFPVSYFVNGVSKFNRFLKGHFPSKDVMTKFVNSLTFKLNKEDRAQLTEQGLSVIATDANSESRTSNATNGTAFTAFVAPHQIPDVVLAADGSDTVVGTPVELGGLKLSILKRTLAGLFRKNFKLEVIVQDSITIDGATFKLKLVGDVTTPGNSYIYGTHATTGVKGWYALLPIIVAEIEAKVGAAIDGTDFNTAFVVAAGTNNQTVTGMIGTAVTAGTYVVICEADVIGNGANVVMGYGLEKTGAVAINNQNTISTNSLSCVFKLSSIAVVVLTAGQTVTLVVDNVLASINIGARSITMIKIS